ncbi:UNVERIFIED_CONTAM: AUGMIN subunit [Sesamum calycinum]|uniref:AUGMIN subunit n=1 Tax=Sesamum calycinum TaxID=2727403 RepID=A0AAW2LUX3_9LAMI
MVEEYQQAVSVANLGGIRHVQVYKALEHQMVVAEAPQKLRLPLISKDGASANNPFSIGVTDASVPEVGGVPNRFLGITPAYLWQTQLQQAPPIDITESQVLLAREIASRLDAKCDKLADAVVIDDMGQSKYFVLPPSLLSYHNLMNIACLACLIRFEFSYGRVKLIIEEIEREELAWREDLYSSDRKFAEYYNDELQRLGYAKDVRP